MSIGQFAQIARVLAALLPVIMELVAALDEVATQEGTGKDKMTLVLDLVRNAFDDVIELDIPWEKIEPYVRSIVGFVLKIVRR